MALYQSSVLKKHLKQQDLDTISRSYKKYSKYFLNSTIQENIRNSKEEQFQATFLTELFVNVLDYVLNPNPNFNLTTEFKNQKNARKADGAILQNNSAIGVIELKGTNTKAQALHTQIQQTDAEIDAMVYELYGLTEDEIAIIENN